jgi:NADPH:quinone reductase-like Zn-dependent oxidoreductase
MGARVNQRIVVTRRGAPDVLDVVEEPIPEPASGEVRLQVLAAGVSAYDLMVRSIRFPGNPRPPFTPGEDVVGLVDAVGEDVTGLELGQRVAGWTFGDGGGYASHVCRPERHLVPVPAGLDDAVAVALVVNYLTAHLYLHRTAAVRSGDRILVHGAAGGLGSALVELGRNADLELYGTASSHNHPLVATLGATPIDYRTDVFEQRILELTGDGVDAVFDTVGGPRQLWRSYRCLRAGGKLVPIGSVATARSGMKVIPLSLATIGLLKLVPDGRSVPLSPNMMRYPHRHLGWYRETLTELLDQAAAGDLEPLLDECFPLTEAAAAHALLERGPHAGKVVLVADG